MWIRKQNGTLINTDALNSIYVGKWRDDEDENFVKYQVYGELTNENVDRYARVVIASFDSEREADDTVSAIFSNITRGLRTFDLMR